MNIIHGSNERRVYEFGNEFGFVGYILAEDVSDAYEYMLDYEAEHGNVCDHGGDITDEERWAEYSGEKPSTCDCSVSSDGAWVWDVYLWVRNTGLSVDLFYLAFPEESLDVYANV